MSISKHETDQELFTRLRLGEAAALDELFRRYYADLCRVAMRFVNNEQEAEDIIQELFVSIWEKRASQRKDLSAIGSYLRRAARNRSLNYLRDRKRIPVDDGEVPTTIAALDKADDLLEQSELRGRIDAAIDALPERCRLVFVMSKIEEMSHKEIAGALDISPKTVENQMTRAYRFLREWLVILLLIILQNDW
ncbi:RNA polymerase sigma-70 factor [Neolewinella aurantiaca]|uniref:RNA polymerase sigma-70 factor n=1 Tax=Neolewinella aurantiaca TaxID=2602767 RepID=A0A5C7FHC9_9BACT|nr:RNA polymerase sigma-70 factor [Neolewinella aurantiaca]TXF85694.1 RNA polymerase sigma-70 factor [Neolewinella aurantiaca]